jgi:hypothetical protein
LEDEQVEHLGIGQHASNAENRHIDPAGLLGDGC